MTAFLSPAMSPAMAVASATAPQRPSVTRVLYGELRTGRISGVIDATGASWAETLNAAGSVDQVTVPEAVVRALSLRTTCPAARSFLAVEQDDRIRQAGPIWSRGWDWKTGQLTLGAAGLWSLFDHRTVIPVLAAGQTVQTVTTTLTGADLGEIARGLVAQAMMWTGGNLPLVLPTPRPGSAHTETFPGWKLLNLTDQLKQLTQREVAAPDIRFSPRRRTDDPRYIEWVMETGTEAAPQLSQVGADWVFDTTAARGPVQGISVDEDATAMGMRGWVTGNGQEENILIGTDYDPTLIDLGWPLLEQEENRSTDELQATLDGHAANLVARSARPVEVWKIDVQKDAVRETRAGDYARVVTRGDAWIPDGEHRVRVRQISGGLGDTATVESYPLQAVL